jgi:hypothetical protein
MIYVFGINTVYWTNKLISHCVVTLVEEDAVGMLLHIMIDGSIHSIHSILFDQLLHTHDRFLGLGEGGSDITS